MRARPLVALALLCAAQTAISCTVDVPSVIVEMGEHEINTAPDLTEVITTVTVTCPAGVNYRLAPYSSSTNSNIQLPMTQNVSANGYSYLMMKRVDGVLMRSADNNSQITGTGTDAPQEYQVRLFLAGSSTPTVAVNKLGDFDRTFRLFRLRRLDNNGTVDSVPQQIIGRIVGSCAISSGGDVDFGMIESPAGAKVYAQATTLGINCTTGISYRIYADRPTGSANTWITNSIRPIPEKPAEFLLYFSLRQQGGNTFLNVSNGLYQAFTATGTVQQYDLKVELSLASKALGAFDISVQPSIVF